MWSEDLEMFGSKVFSIIQPELYEISKTGVYLLLFDTKWTKAP